MEAITKAIHTLAIGMSLTGLGITMALCANVLMLYYTTKRKN